MQNCHLWKSIYKRNLGTTWVRGVIHWTNCGSIQISPDICEQKNIGYCWEWITVIPPSYQNYIHIFSKLIHTGLSILSRGTTTSRYWGTIFKNWWKEFGSPKITGNHTSNPPKQTWCTSKGGTDKKVVRNIKGEHSCTTKGGADNQCTRSKGGYTPKTYTHHTIVSHNKVQVQRKDRK